MTESENTSLYRTIAIQSRVPLRCFLHQHALAFPDRHCPCSYCAAARATLAAMPADVASAADGAAAAGPQEGR